MGENAQVDQEIFYDGIQWIADHLTDGRPRRWLLWGSGVGMIAENWEYMSYDFDMIDLDNGGFEDEVLDLIEEYAEQNYLTYDWLNDSPYTFSTIEEMAYLGRNEVDRITFEGELGTDITVIVLDPKDAIVDKCRAGRDKDVGMLKWMLPSVGIDNYKDAIDLVNERRPELQQHDAINGLYTCTIETLQSVYGIRDDENDEW